MEFKGVVKMTVEVGPVIKKIFREGIMEDDTKKTCLWDVYYRYYDEYSYYTFDKTIEAVDEADVERKIRSANEGVYVFFSIKKKSEEV